MIPGPPSAFPHFKSVQLLQVQDLARQLQAHAKSAIQDIEALNALQLRRLLGEANHSLFWKRRLAQAGLIADRVSNFREFQGLPHLTRAELQAHFAELRTWEGRIEPSQIGAESTTGSTGQPITVERITSTYALLYSAVMLLEQTWHRLNLDQPFGFYRHGTQDRDDAVHGFPFNELGARGTGYSRSIALNDLEHLYQPLHRFKPAQISGSPTLMRLLAERALAVPPDIRPKLDVINTLGEAVDPSLRQLVHSVFGARLIDRYSCGELGLVALQCPKHEHYHVVNGLVHLEIVDDNDQPCPVGVPGQVLVTGLHSYAMPLIRYELGDVAEWGPPCDCGIQWPVIKAIHGKTRNYITLPDGRRHFVTLGGDFAHHIKALRSHHVNFYEQSGCVEFLYVAGLAMCPTEEAELIRQIHQRFGSPWAVEIRKVDILPPPTGWKRAEFTKV